MCVCVCVCVWQGGGEVWGKGEEHVVIGQVSQESVKLGESIGYNTSEMRWVAVNQGEGRWRSMGKCVNYS